MWKSIPEKDRRELLRSFDPDNDPPRVGKISIHFNLGRVRGIGLTLLQVFFRTVEIRPQVGQRNKQETIFPLRRVIPTGQCSADHQPVPIRGMKPFVNSEVVSPISFGPIRTGREHFMSSTQVRTSASQYCFSSITSACEGLSLEFRILRSVSRARKRTSSVAICSALGDFENIRLRGPTDYRNHYVSLNLTDLRVGTNWEIDHRCAVIHVLVKK
jgi:hypothetical protein